MLIPTRPIPSQTGLVMRNQTTVSARFHPSEIQVIDQVAKREGLTRNGVIREAVALRVSMEKQVDLVREEIREALEGALTQLRLDAQKQLREYITAASASDQTNRQLINTFLDALSDGAPAQPNGLPPPRR